MTLDGPLVSTDWLAERLQAPDVVAMDATWYLPPETRDPQADYLAAHIPGALFFDIEGLSDKADPRPHMLAPPEAFADAMSAMGIGDDTTVVVYDAHGLYSAARGWWTLRAMGHDKVAVLDGGLPKWRSEGRPIEAGAPKARPRARFTPRRVDALIGARGDIERILADGSAQIVDARAAARFEGSAPEPRPGLRPGHIPGSRNLPYGALLNADGTLKAPAQLTNIFDAAGIGADRPAVTTCGSGISAAIVTLALEAIGRPSAVYDASWSEWGADPSLPVETGPARR